MLEFRLASFKIFEETWGLHGDMEINNSTISQSPQQSPNPQKNLPIPQTNPQITSNPPQQYNFPSRGRDLSKLNLNDIIYYAKPHQDNT
jgi:hypothetical protein